MSPGTAKVVLHLREVHSCLMELDRTKILHLQSRCIFLNFMEGDGRMLDIIPHYYYVPDGRGGEIAKETYFRYIDRVH